MVECLFIVLAPAVKNLFIPGACGAIGLDYCRLPSWDVSSGDHSHSPEYRANLAPISVLAYLLFRLTLYSTKPLTNK